MYINLTQFTQLIWPTTTKVGCAISGDIVACEYDPHGNIMGAPLTFTVNVQ
jgi:hypothetical protein